MCFQACEVTSDGTHYQRKGARTHRHHALICLHQPILMYMLASFSFDDLCSFLNTLESHTDHVGGYIHIYIFCSDNAMLLYLHNFTPLKCRTQTHMHTTAKTNTATKRAKRPRIAHGGYPTAVKITTLPVCWENEYSHQASQSAHALHTVGTQQQQRPECNNSATIYIYIYIYIHKSLSTHIHMWLALLLPNC